MTNELEMVLDFVNARCFSNKDISKNTTKYDEQKRKDILKKIIKELPVSPYFSTVYITLISIICALSLGVLLGNFFDDISDISIFLTFKTIITAFVIALVWHNYTVYNQFGAWDIELSDTALPFIFAIFLMFMVSSVNYEDITYFIFSFSLINMTFACAYTYAIKRINNSKNLILSMYDDVFGKEFSRDLYYTIINFKKKNVQYFSIFGIVFFIITLISYFISSNTFTLILFVPLCSISIYITKKLDVVQEIRRIYS